MIRIERSGCLLWPDANDPKRISKAVRAHGSGIERKRWIKQKDRSLTVRSFQDRL